MIGLCCPRHWLGPHLGLCCGRGRRCLAVAWWVRLVLCGDRVRAWLCCVLLLVLSLSLVCTRCWCWLRRWAMLCLVLLL